MDRIDKRGFARIAAKNLTDENRLGKFLGLPKEKTIAESKPYEAIVIGNGKMIDVTGVIRTAVECGYTVQEVQMALSSLVRNERLNAMEEIKTELQAVISKLKKPKQYQHIENKHRLPEHQYYKQQYKYHR